MRYIRQSLLRDEKLMYATKPHWIVFGPSLWILLLAFFVYDFLPLSFGHQLLWQQLSVRGLMSGGMVLVGVVVFFRTLIFLTTSEYAVTNRRVMMKMGWLSQDAIEIFLQRIEAINVSQTIFGRIFNYGTVIVIGTGGTNDYYPNVPNPRQFHRAVQQQMSNLMNLTTNAEAME